MSRTLGNGSIELELGSGEWTARWSECGITLGPCHMDVEAGAWRADHGRGAWHVETTRTGARVRWTRTDATAWFELRLPADGDVLEVQAGYRPERDDQVGRVISLFGEVTPALDRQLVNGYDSWSYAGVRGGLGRD